MLKTESPLPDDPQELRKFCAQLQSQLADNERLIGEQEARIGLQQKTITEQIEALQAKQETIAYLQEQLALLRSKRYQARSEQLKALQGQLFDEAELEQAIREAEQALAEAQQTAGKRPSSSPVEKKSVPRRKPLPDHLKRVDVLIDVSDEDKQLMGDDWELIGYQTSEQLAVRQREYYVKCLKRAKYVRKQADQGDQYPAGSEPGIKVAPRAPVMLPKAIADSSLLADVITSKFVDAVSFYRTERILKREGIEIGYSTLCEWPIQLAERLQPLVPLLMEYLASGPLWHLDETTLQVLREPERNDRSKSYLWGIRGGPPDQPAILFHYHERRNYDALKAWLDPALKGFAGVIVSDEHKPYNRLVEEYPQITGHGGCWAHCRRKFSDAAKGRRSGSEAHKVLQQIAVLYRLDNGLRDLKGEAKRQARQELVVPQLNKIQATLNTLDRQFPSQGLMHTAIYYALNNWHKLTAFLDHPVMPLDNNPMEQAIRPFTLGRRNWLFSGSPRGANASALLYSLVESAKANGWEPKAYLIALFERYPLAASDDERRALLPMFLKPGT